MTDPELISEICQYAAKLPADETLYPTDVPGLWVLHDTAPTRLEAILYDPVICLVLQGRKETRIGDRRIDFGAGDSLIVSHAVPVLAAVTEASRSRPYVAIILAVDLGIARMLCDEMNNVPGVQDNARSLVAARTNPQLIDAMGRLFRASQDPLEAKALAPLIVREVHFRLLQADHGSMLRQMMRADSAASKIGKAIARIQAEYKQPIPVYEMARTAGMSVSAFHARFKAITARSPLQYQKDLRLMEARRLLGEGATTVSAAAYAVGYESPTQFSREYARKFGVPPRKDKVKSLAA